jgi:hypothetical protein
MSYTATPQEPIGSGFDQDSTAADVLAGLGGVYCEDVDVAVPYAEGARRGVRDWATDPEQAARLWALSAELTGVDAFA